MYPHIWGSHRAKFDDNDFNSVRGTACEEQTNRQTDGQEQVEQVQETVEVVIVIVVVVVVVVADELWREEKEAVIVEAVVW